MELRRDSSKSQPQGWTCPQRSSIKSPQRPQVDAYAREKFESLDAEQQAFVRSLVAGHSEKIHDLSAFVSGDGWVFRDCLGRFQVFRVRLE